MNTRNDVAWHRSKWLSKSAAALYIHRDVRELQRLIDEGTIPASAASGARRGRNLTPVVYIHIDDLDAYMRSIPYEGASTVSCPAKPAEKLDGPHVRIEAHPDETMTYERGREIARAVTKAAARAKKRKTPKAGEGA